MGGGSTRQTGVALLYVLLLFSMITLMASQIVTSLFLHTEKNTRFLERTQAKHYALGAEQYVAYLLEEDFIEDKKKKRRVDHEKKRWNIKNVDYDIEQGYIEIAVVDEQGRFNLNWLCAEDDEGAHYLRMFQNLLRDLTIESELASHLQTWLGAAPGSAGGAAADNAYLLMTPPRRAGNTPMVSVSELRLVEGMNEAIFERLAPLVTVLPFDTQLNLNTALPQVLMSLSDKMTESDAMAIIEGRGNNGFAKLEELRDIIAIRDKMADIKMTPVSFFSQYFSTYIKATYRDTTFYLKTLLVRNSKGRVQVAGREIGPNSYWVKSTKDS